MSAKPRVGLVLGAGGPVGHAFHAGVLRGLSEVTGWDPRSAEVIVGTSAGAQVAGLLRAGMEAWELAARISGEPLSTKGAFLARHYVRPSHDFDLVRTLLPNSTSWNSIRLRVQSFLSAHPVAHLLALLPEGRVSLEPQAAGFREMFPEGWPEQALWIPTVCVHNGHRVVFGQEGAPDTDVGSAVTASGAVPVICRPVKIENHRYVDGGFRSLTSLDILVGEGLDLVIVSSPMTREHGPGPSGPSHRVRASLRRKLEQEASCVRESGTPVVIFQPAPAEAESLGLNMMDTDLMAQVTDSTHRNMLRKLKSPHLLGQIRPLTG